MEPAYKKTQHYMTPQQKALHLKETEAYKQRFAKDLANRKGSAEFYVNGKPKVAGKTKAQIKAETKQAWLNRHKDPNYKGLSNYKTDTSHFTGKEH